MNKNLLKIFSYIVITLIFLFIVILICKNFNNISKKNKENKVKTEKISVSTLIINSNNTHNSISINDLTIDNNLLITYNKIINSKNVKKEIKEKFSNVKEIELEKIEDTEIIKTIYVCDKKNEKECIDINNEYVYLFSNVINDIYNVNISIVDKATITTRIIKEK